MQVYLVQRQETGEGGQGIDWLEIGARYGWTADQICPYHEPAQIGTNGCTGHQGEDRIGPLIEHKSVGGFYHHFIPNPIDKFVALVVNIDQIPWLKAIKQGEDLIELSPTPPIVGAMAGEEDIASSTRQGGARIVPHSTLDGLENASIAVILSVDDGCIDIDFGDNDSVHSRRGGFLIDKVYQVRDGTPRITNGYWQIVFVGEITIWLGEPIADLGIQSRSHDYQTEEDEEKGKQSQKAPNLAPDAGRGCGREVMRRVVVGCLHVERAS